VIRYLTTKVDENIDVAARPSEIDDSSYDKAAQTAADEEDLFLSRGSDETPSHDEDDYVDEDFVDEPVAVPAPTTEEKE
jgi:hypothetical protein